MEDVLKKILSIDNTASEMVRKNKKELHDKEQEFKEKQELMKNEAEAAAIKNGKGFYTDYIKKAEKQAAILFDSSKEKCNIMDKKFLEIKEALENEIFNEIIESSFREGLNI